MAPHANVDEPSPIPEVAVDAGLTTISIGKLMSGDESTQKQLLRAATDLGFFYLDVRDHPSGQLISRIDQVTSTALEFYALPQEQKSEWEVNKDHTEGEEIIMG
jgi:isopenicillin N synthase-like dioxygenase